MSSDESYELGLDAAYRAFNGEGDIKLTDTMVAALVELYCGLGMDPPAKALRRVCTFEQLCRITETKKEDWVKEFGQPFIDADLTEFSAGFFEGVNTEQRRRFFAARRH
jgi:hypothetical protein